MKSIFKQIRKENNLTQDQLATILGTHRTTIFDLEHANRTKVNDRILRNLNAIGYSKELVKKAYAKQRERQQQELLQEINK